MGRMLKSCLQSLLKLVNSTIGMAGLAMILYSLWMFRVWYKNMDDWDSDSPTPWFIYTFLGLGISLFVITCSGHIAAETANGACLSCYMVFIFILVLAEAAVTADVFLNSHWEEDFPEDATGKLDELKNFVKSNFEMCKWIGLLVVASQALSITLSMILRALGPDRGRYYDSDEEYSTARLPFLKDHAHSTAYPVPPNADSWNARVYEKANR